MDFKFKSNHNKDKETSNIAKTNRFLVRFPKDYKLQEWLVISVSEIKYNILKDSYENIVIKFRNSTVGDTQSAIKDIITKGVFNIKIELINENGELLIVHDTTVEPIFLEYNKLNVEIDNVSTFSIEFKINKIINEIYR